MMDATKGRLSRVPVSGLDSEKDCLRRWRLNQGLKNEQSYLVWQQEISPSQQREQQDCDQEHKVQVTKEAEEQGRGPDTGHRAGLAARTLRPGSDLGLSSENS